MEHIDIIHRSHAKLKHVQACLDERSQYEEGPGFDEVALTHESASELSLADISLETSFLGYSLKAPLMIAPMTGGIKLGAMLNERWARASHHFGIAMGVGSQRLALENDEVENTFRVRRFAKDALLFANLGAAQLVLGMTSEHALKAVKMIEANALFIHLNPLQEAVKPGGDTSFKGILKAISRIVSDLSRHEIPVLVREVGFGLSEESARRLIETGISGLDCAGAGGTSWTKVEALCSGDPSFRRAGMVFGEWGIKTAHSIKNVRFIDNNIPLIATGGLRSGLDLAKALYLGADVGAMAQPMLKHAIKGEDDLFQFIEQIILELKICLLASGAQNPQALQSKNPQLKFKDSNAADLLAPLDHSEHRPS